MEQFNFGKNWKDFSQKALTAERVEIARKDIANLFEGIDLKDKTFLDIGFGQGLSLLLVTEAGALTVGNDINPLSRDIIVYNQERLFPYVERTIPVIIDSILEENTIRNIKETSGNDSFDIVHSWGVLHHTGEMWRAIDLAESLVSPDGVFVLAIYNRHFTSKLWWYLKRIYNALPGFLQKLVVYLFLIPKGLNSLRLGYNPFKPQRGMSFYYDAVDWLGGYPYEYASVAEISEYMQKKGYELKKLIPVRGGTGCNQFVFVRKKSS